MYDDNFEYGWLDDEGASESPQPPTGSVEALEQWLVKNYRLWEMGLQLAIQARHYRQEYSHIPFNNSGWYSPN